jgi:hypothetical protein
MGVTATSDNIITRDELIRALTALNAPEAEKVAETLFLSVRILRMSDDLERRYPPEDAARWAPDAD